jgi:uncharacterized protein involved in exopolysaccharide biosynthesis
MQLHEVIERWRRHRVLVLTVLLIGAVLVVFALRRTPPRYAADASVLLVAEPPESQNKAVPTIPSKPVLADDLPSLVTSSTVLERVRRDLSLNVPLDTLQTRVRAKVANGSNVMPIRFTADTPERAMAGANAVADELSNYYREIATKRFESLERDLRAQLAARRAQLAEIDAKLADAARKYPYVDTRDSDVSVYARLIKLQTERDDAAAAAAGDSALSGVTAKRTDQVQPLARSEIGERDPRYRNLRDQYAKDLTRLEATKARYSEQYPGLPELTDTLAREKASLAAAGRAVDRTPAASSPSYAQALADRNKADAQAASSRARVAVINQQIASIHSTLNDSSALNVSVARLRRDRDAADAANGILAARLAQTEADRADAATTGSVIVMNRAVTAQRAVWTTATALVACLSVLVVWLAFGLPFLIETLDRRFRAPATIESIYGAPIIAGVR